MISNGNRTLSLIVRHGKSVAFWNAIPTFFTGPVTASPATLTVPREGSTRPVTTFIRVDLPHPLGPTTATNCPLPTVSDRLSSAKIESASSPYDKLTSRSSTNAGGIGVVAEDGVESSFILSAPAASNPKGHSRVGPRRHPSPACLLPPPAVPSPCVTAAKV